jgi:hypothetical protein
MSLRCSGYLKLTAVADGDRAAHDRYRQFKPKTSSQPAAVRVSRKVYCSCASYS